MEFYKKYSSEDLAKFMDCKNISSEDLAEYTESFSKKNLLGYTQYGELYRGKIQDKEVLVKRWVNHRKYRKYQHIPEFSIPDEIVFLHDQSEMVNVIGYCIMGPDQGIIYDLNPMDSLHNLIIKDNFNWIQRIKVARKFAELLVSLHNQNYLVRNLDAAHIMIDQDFNPILIDFTMLSGGIMGDRTSQEKRVHVIPGYIAPDRLRGGEWTVKADVFVYGIILVSLIAKRVFDGKEPDKPFVNEWALEVYDPKDPQSLVHESIQKESASVAADGLAITILAMRCLEDKEVDRPTMEEIIQGLQTVEGNWARDEYGPHDPQQSFGHKIIQNPHLIKKRRILAELA